MTSIPPRRRLLPQRRNLARSIPAAVRALDASVKLDLKRAVPAVIIAVLAFGFGEHLDGLYRTSATSVGLLGRTIHLSSNQIVAAVAVLSVVFVLSGVVATRSIGREFARVLSARGSIDAGNAMRLVCSITGYAILSLGVLTLLRINLENLLVGGAVTGVVLGIAAQQTLGNFFAGLVLLFARPYVAGQRVKIRTGALGGPFEGVIISSGLVYTTIDTTDGIVSMPNSGLLAAAIGPAADDAAPSNPAPEPPDEAAAGS